MGTVLSSPIDAQASSFSKSGFSSTSKGIIGPFGNTSSPSLEGASDLEVSDDVASLLDVLALAGPSASAAGAAIGAVVVVGTGIPAPPPPAAPPSELLALAGDPRGVPAMASINQLAASSASLSAGTGAPLDEEEDLCLSFFAFRSPSFFSPSFFFFPFFSGDDDDALGRSLS